MRPGDGRASAPSAHTFDQSRARPNNNLPRSLTTFIGRETELREIIALVREQRLVTLTGTGGVGKTRSALEIGAQVLDGSADDVWLVNLAPLHDASLVAATIARALEVEASPGRPVLETLVAYLKAKALLLIVDNCEHVIEQTAIVVNAVLRGCPKLRILATSREPLRVAGEYRYRLPSLRVTPREADRRLAVADAVQYSAVVLFAERARAVSHMFCLAMRTCRSSPRSAGGSTEFPWRSNSLSRG